MPEVVGIADSRALSEERQETALAEHDAGRFERVLIRLAATDREGSQPYQELPVACLDQLGLRHEAQVPARVDADEERVPEALVVGATIAPPSGGMQFAPEMCIRK
jgi:hypothetical protein